MAADFAFQSTWAARRRVILALVGVGIGFGAIDSMLVIGDSVEARVKESMASLGGDVLALAVQDPAATPNLRTQLVAGSQAPLGMAQSEGLSAQKRHVVSRLIGAMPEVRASAWYVQEASCVNGFADGGAPGYEAYRSELGIEQLLSLQLSSGRHLNAADRDQATVIVGSDAITWLRQRQPSIGVGSSIILCGRAHRIVGVLQPHRGADLLPAMQINRALLSVAGQDQLGSGVSAPTLLVSLRHGVDARPFGQSLGQRVSAVIDPLRVDVAGAWEILKLRVEQVDLYSSLLAVLGGVALLIGGLGVSNMMVVSVSERRSEIGLRMAVGARRADIVAQFICECVLVCLAGSVLGLVAGFGVAAIALSLGGFAPSLSQGVLLKATFLALACGVVAGAYPAYRAASVRPISSLQGTSDTA